MTVFITHCWKSVQSELNGPKRTSFWLRVLLLCLFVAAAFSPTVHAQAPNGAAVEVTELRLGRRSDTALLLQSSLRLDLSPVVEECVAKGHAPVFCDRGRDHA
jgi:hypothetical protein